MTDIDALVATANYEKDLSMREKRFKYKRRASKLDVHASTIYQLHERGLSYRQIANTVNRHLKPKVECSHSTVERYLKRSDSSSITKL